MNPESVAGWLLTYAIHSAVACATALAAGRTLVRAPRDRDLLWKAALVLPLLTSLGALATRLSDTSRTELNVSRWVRSFATASFGAVDVDVVSTLDASGMERRQERVDDPLARTVALATIFAALLAGAAATARTARQHGRLRNELAGREPMTAEIVPRHAPPRVLRSGRVLRLSLAARLGSPLALGRDEVCVGPSFLGLTCRQQASILEHEVAHLERRDPAWIMAADWFAAVTAFQPLNRFVASALRRDTEFVCDETAVRRTGDPGTLVESLASIAASYDRAIAGAVGYAGSPLIQRAERILATGDGGTPSPWSRRFAVAAISVIIALLMALPVVSSAAAEVGAGESLVIEREIQGYLR